MGPVGEWVVLVAGLEDLVESMGDDVVLGVADVASTAQVVGELLGVEHAGGVGDQVIAVGRRVPLTWGFLAARTGFEPVPPP